MVWKLLRGDNSDLVKSSKLLLRAAKKRFKFDCRACLGFVWKSFNVAQPMLCSLSLMFIKTVVQTFIVMCLVTSLANMGSFLGYGVCLCWNLRYLKTHQTSASPLSSSPHHTTVVKSCCDPNYYYYIVSFNLLYWSSFIVILGFSIGTFITKGPKKDYKLS